VNATEQIITAARTANGGWTRAQLAEWGVPWPPPKRWKHELVSEDALNSATKLSGDAPIVDDET
jgi:hypothetical protein